MSQCRTCIVFPGTNIALFCRAWCPPRVPWRLPDTNLVQFSCSLFQVSGGALGIPYDPLGLWESLGGSTDQQMLCFKGPWASLMVPWRSLGAPDALFSEFQGCPLGSLIQTLFSSVEPCSVQLFPFPSFTGGPWGPS